MYFITGIRWYRCAQPPANFRASLPGCETALPHPIAGVLLQFSLTKWRCSDAPRTRFQQPCPERAAETLRGSPSPLPSPERWYAAPSGQVVTSENPGASLSLSPGLDSLSPSGSMRLLEHLRRAPYVLDFLPTLSRIRVCSTRLETWSRGRMARPKAIPSSLSIIISLSIFSPEQQSEGRGWR